MCWRLSRYWHPRITHPPAHVGAADIEAIETAEADITAEDNIGADITTTDIMAADTIVLVTVDSGL